mmetsp:Transcript_31075/g.80935  ORF Transcript_31075/g.80935 Transcript_31075/m.80935 type:complete len:117 (-) Transcript_31075:1685-2035(-)
MHNNFRCQTQPGDTRVTRVTRETQPGDTVRDLLQAKGSISSSHERALTRSFVWLASFLAFSSHARALKHRGFPQGLTSGAMPVPAAYAARAELVCPMGGWFSQCGDRASLSIMQHL